jgi:hypothetical protein
VDGGRAWRVTGSKLPFDSAGLDSSQPTVLFPTPTLGYVNGGGTLQMTRDAGRTWTVVVFRGWVRAISRYGSSFWAFVAPCAATAVCRYQLETTTLGDNSWHRVGPLPLGNFAPLVVTRLGPRLALAAIGQIGPTPAVLTTDGGRHWSSVRACKPKGFVPTSLAVLASDRLWVLCIGGGGMSRAAYSLLSSADGGTSWHLLAADRNLATNGPIPAAPGATLAVTAGQRLWLADYFGLAESVDSGRKWVKVVTFGKEGFSSEFSFLSPTVGWLLVPQVGLWRTSNGRSWQKV